MTINKSVSSSYTLGENEAGHCSPPSKAVACVSFQRDFIQAHLVSIAPSALNTAMLAIAFCLIELLVQSLGPPLHPYAESNRAQAPKENESSAQTIKWFLTCREEVRREPM